MKENLHKPSTSWRFIVIKNGEPKFKFFIKYYQKRMKNKSLTYLIIFSIFIETFKYRKDKTNLIYELKNE